MQTLGNAREHFFKVSKMSQACDVDLVEALDKGQINSGRWADMVERCQRCAQVGKCDRLMDGQPKLDAAPDYCENRDTFAELRKP